jgi:hypothetical protein
MKILQRLLIYDEPTLMDVWGDVCQVPQVALPGSATGAGHGARTAKLRLT